MPIALIAAAAGKKQVIGKNGDLPWHLPSDLRFFKKTTLGHPVVMGRTTYQSIFDRIGKPLPDRENIVLTRNSLFGQDHPGVKVILTPGEIVPLSKGKQLFVIGGASLYEQTMAFADKIYLTKIDQEIDGDTFFPEINEEHWRLEGETPPVEENGMSFNFCVYERRIKLYAKPA